MTKEVIRRFVVADLLDGEEVDDGEDLLLSGLVDSMGVMRLVAFMEEEFNLSIPPQDVTIENFSSLDTLADYLERVGSQVDLSPDHVAGRDA